MGRANSGQLGRYEIVKHLANGGMAQVLLAKATGIEGFTRHVVVKRIHTQRTGDPAFVKMFLDEARLAATLHHHNIVQVHDIGQEGGEYFFAMEYIHGEDLRHLLTEVSRRKAQIPFEHIVSIVMAAASALHYAHEMRGPDRKPLGLVHRDVSPANIIVGYDGNVKVVDFGIAKAAALRDSNTAGGMLKGKVSYMAPEQCAGKSIDRRSDVYALGVVLHELVTVRRLFKGDNDFLMMSAIVQGDVPFPSKYRPDIPPALEDIIFKALSVDPDARYATADDMKRALDEFAANAGLRTSTTALADYMKSLFGDKPEPWLADDNGPLELSIDFDGEGRGLAEAPAASRERLAMPASVAPAQGAPIERARKKAITDGPAAKAAALAAPQRRGKRPSVMIPPKRTASVPITTAPSPTASVPVTTAPTRTASVPVTTASTRPTPSPTRPTPSPASPPPVPSRPTPVPAKPMVASTEAPRRPTPVPTDTTRRQTPVPTVPMSPASAAIPTHVSDAASAQTKPRRSTPAPVPMSAANSAAVPTHIVDAPSASKHARRNTPAAVPVAPAAASPMSWPTGTETRISSEHTAVSEPEIDEDAATFIADKQMEQDLAAIGAEPMVAKPAATAPAPAPAANRAPSLELDIVVDDVVTRAPVAKATEPAAAPARRTKLYVGVALVAVASAAAVLFAVNRGDTSGTDAPKARPASTTTTPARAKPDQPITPPNLANDVMSTEAAPSTNTDEPAAGSGASDTPPPSSDHAAVGAGETSHDANETPNTDNADSAAAPAADTTADTTGATTDASVNGASKPATKEATSTKAAPVKVKPKRPVAPEKPAKPAAQDKGSWNPDQLFPE